MHIYYYWTKETECKDWSSRESYFPRENVQLAEGSDLDGALSDTTLHRPT